MRLTVLGGSAAGPNAGQGCSGYLLEGIGGRIVLDLGPGTLPELRRHVDYRTIGGIVVSHLHLDHVLDLFALRFLLAYNPVPPPRPVPLLLPPGGAAFLRAAAAPFAGDGNADRFFGSLFQVAEYDPALPTNHAGFTIRFAPTVHYVPCWAMRIGDGSGRGDLVYGADGGPASALAPFADDAAVLVAEAAAIEPTTEPWGERGHMTPAEAAALAAEVKAGVLVLTHVWEEVGVERAAAEAARHFAGRIVAARSGAYVEW